MTIERGLGNLLDADVEALVNAVNTVGVMGKGLALQFKERFPDVFDDYARACAAGEVVIGKMHVVRRRGSSKYVIDFPTKAHWRQPSKIGYVQEGLVDLTATVRRLKMNRPGIPGGSMS